MWALVLLVFLCACGADQLVELPDPPSVTPCCAIGDRPPLPRELDNDGDGFAANDCDDGDPEVHPLAFERCNQRDDDCDGSIDEEVPLVPCYDADPATLHHGACRVGLTECLAGELVCTGAIYPRPEECEGSDDDCDGTVDEVGPAYDVVLVLDTSASMMPYRGYVLAALAALAYPERFQWALVTVPGRVQVVSDFVDATTLYAHAAAQHEGARLEPTLDAIAALRDRSNPLGLSWRTGAARRIVLATDEVPQSLEGWTVEAVAALPGPPVYVLGTKTSEHAFLLLAAMTFLFEEAESGFVAAAPPTCGG